MNERIKQLLNEATSGHEQEYDALKWMTVSDKEMDKFAELIVRECAGRVDHILRERQAGGGTMGDDIREHFGVEE
jgi:hypothetical protein